MLPGRTCSAMPGGDTSSQRRKLMAGLRRARSAAGLTQRVAAERLNWSQSKLIRIENGAVGISVTDLRAMLQLYRVTDQQSIEDLSNAALHSRGLSWWSRFRDVVSPQFATYLGQEASASSIAVFHPFLIPGLLHTREYATALLEPHTRGQQAQLSFVKLFGPACRHEFRLRCLAAGGGAGRRWFRRRVRRVAGRPSGGRRGCSTAGNGRGRPAAGAAAGCTGRIGGAAYRHAPVPRLRAGRGARAAVLLAASR